MLLRLLSFIWIAITAFMVREYLILHQLAAGKSYLTIWSCRYLKYCEKLTPEAGRPLSFYLGIAGFTIMAMGNFYLIRKRWGAIRNWGNIQDWLSWHIFFGLLGPTLIVFHANFKVGGLVAISFWSMMVSFSSGIVGRFFYMQVLETRESLRKGVHALDEIFARHVQEMRHPQAAQAMELAKLRAYQMVGGVPPERISRMGILRFLTTYLLGDLFRFFRLPPAPWGNSYVLRQALKRHAIMRKKLISFHVFKILFGYWHSFHSPFAVFMYIVAVIHIISSLIFKVH